MPEVNKQIEYSRLLETLHDFSYCPTMKMDENRYKDGIDLRTRYCDLYNIDPRALFNEFEPCTMLELMVALSMRVENYFMSDPEKGNRTCVWFNEMLYSLGLNEQTNVNYSYDWITFRIDIFNSRKYNKNGYGSLFTIQNPDIDLRDYEIWDQMCFFINEYDSQDYIYAL